MSNIKLKFCGGVEGTTGVNYLLTIGQTKILVDCGMFQGPANSEKKNWEPFPYDPKKIEAVFITHAHLDHIGRLPKLYRDGFRGKIYATPPTIDLARLSLEDAVRVLKGKTKTRGLKPFFDEKDVRGVMDQFVALNYKESVKIGDGIEAELLNAGHILGSAQVRIQISNLKSQISNKSKIQKSKTIRTDRTFTTIVFTGDLGNWPVPLMYPPEFPKSVDYLVIESTYGDKIHEPVSERKEKLERAIEYIAASGGTLMIPSFALERAQELLFELNELVENKRVPAMPIFLDSPLTERAIEVYKKYPNFYRSTTPYLVRPVPVSGQVPAQNGKISKIIYMRDDFFKFPGLKITKTAEDSEAINGVLPPKVIIAGSGMMSGGRILHHLKRYLPDSNSYLLIITYQAEGTLGRKIFDIQYGKSPMPENSVRVLGKETPIRCRIRAVSAYSSHADQAKLREFVEHLGKPEPPEKMEGLKQVFVVQGEDDSALAFSQFVNDHLGIPASTPKLGEEAELD